MEREREENGERGKKGHSEREKETNKQTRKKETSKQTRMIDT